VSLATPQKRCQWRITPPCHTRLDRVSLATPQKRCQWRITPPCHTRLDRVSLAPHKSAANGASHRLVTPDLIGCLCLAASVGGGTLDGLAAVGPDVDAVELLVVVAVFVYVHHAVDDAQFSCIHEPM
jgi:hypothetical protein